MATRNILILLVFTCLTSSALGGTTVFSVDSIDSDSSSNSNGSNSSGSSAPDRSLKDIIANSCSDSRTSSVSTSAVSISSEMNQIALILDNEANDLSTNHNAAKKVELEKVDLPVNQIKKFLKLRFSERRIDAIWDAIHTRLNEMEKTKSRESKMILEELDPEIEIELEDTESKAVKLMIGKRSLTFKGSKKNCHRFAHILGNKFISSIECNYVGASEKDLSNLNQISERLKTQPDKTGLVVPYRIDKNPDRTYSEYYEGGELENATYEPEEIRLEILRQLSKGLATLHKMGVCHRDIKLPNSVYSLGPPIKAALIDYDLSEVYEEDPSLRKRRAIGAAGSHGYTAPEVSDKMEADAEECFKTDMYSFGVLAMKLMAGDSYMDVYRWEDKIKQKKELDPMSQLLNASLIKDVKSRIITAEKFYDEVVRIQDMKKRL